MGSQSELPSDHEIAIISDSTWTADVIEGLCEQIYETKVESPYPETYSFGLGEIAGHKVLLGRPQHDSTQPGYLSAGELAQQFTAMKLVLLVGVCGAVPSMDIGEDSDTSIFLGDVIIGSDIVENEWSKTDDDVRREKSLTDQFGSRRLGVLAFVEELELRKAELESYIRLPQHLCDQIWTGEQSPADSRKIFPSDYRHKNRNPGFRDPEGYDWDYGTFSADLFDEDILFGSDDHYDSADLHPVPERSSCEEMSCDASFMVSRDPHRHLDNKHVIHFGAVSSGRFVRSIEDWEAITRREGVIGLESQCRGPWQSLPSIMVKGVAHHADGHNFDSWRKYAAAVAASATVGILEYWKRGWNIYKPQRDSFISLFADDLLGKVFMTEPEKMALADLYEALPELLHSFAIKAKASDNIHRIRDTVALVRKYRYEIMRTLRHKYREACVPGHRSTGEANKATTSVINEAPATPPGKIRDYEPLDDMRTLVYSLPELPVYRGLIIASPAYKWLLAGIRKILYLSPPQDKPAGIGQAILEYLPKSRWSDIPQRYSLIFTARWDLRSFLQGQEYPGDPQTALERAITITGSTIDAQATTAAQYLKQTWPSTGHYFLQIMQDFVRTKSDSQHTYNLPDGTGMKVSSIGTQFMLEVLGLAESIAEIGDQLAWLGAAFHSPIDDARVSIVRAFVSELKSENRTSQPSFCTIAFDVQALYDTPARLNGQCWQKLFGSPVIVSGYPIPRRPRDGVGLETSLDTMAGLLGTDRINIFRNQIYIKAFAMMLFPTQHFDNIIVWHLLWSDRDRVSYLKSRGILKQNLSISDLESCRHIVGWCMNIRYIIGSGDANYDIGRSWLRSVRENSQLKEVSISQGRLIKYDQKPTLGKRDISPLVTRGTLRAKLESLSKRYVVLWDVRSKRGWLVNGPSALLHLLRASLRSNQIDDLSFAFLFDPATFKEATDPYTVSAALQVLLSPRNLDLALYEDGPEGDSKSGYYRVRDRLNDLYEVVEKMLDYQIMICGKDGVKLRGVPRRDLEGWDFKDIATKEDPIYPRLARLKTIGKGWVDFIRATQAVVLFGRDFGDLVEPSATTDLCSHWENLPCDRYYLAACMGDLKRIFDRSGHLLFMHSGPTSFVWHPSEPTFSPSCRCRGDGELLCEPAQTVWRESASFWELENTSYSGAVVFGHNTQSEWIWRDTGEPERGNPPLSDEESDDNDQAYSGLGSSLRSSAIPERQGALEGPSVARFTHEDYRVAIICALSKELLAVRALFDCSHGALPTYESDTNTYALGSMGNHNVVAACLPSEEYGTNAASKVASDMEKSFPAVKWHFVVGIGGGVPSSEHDIRLGDVVVSTSVVQHDMGRTIQSGSKFESTAIVQRPSRSLMTAISLLQSDPYHTHDCLEPHIEQVTTLRPEYKVPGQHRDRLFEPHYEHEPGQRTCTGCTGPRVNRKPRSPGPRIHYGRIASGNQVIKDASKRDQLAQTSKAICFEMEGAGVMTTGRCLVIRGICDYADSHKNDEWHNYAAATAAAYAKFFVLRLPVLSREMVHLQKRTVACLDEVELSVKRVRYERD